MLGGRLPLMTVTVKFCHAVSIPSENPIEPMSDPREVAFMLAVYSGPARSIASMSPEMRYVVGSPLGSSTVKRYCHGTPSTAVRFGWPIILGGLLGTKTLKSCSE